MHKAPTYDLQIDPVHTARKGQSHPILITLFVLIAMCVMAVGVWFLGFSEFGFAWEYNEAKKLTETPTEVVTSYPYVGISLEQVAATLDLDQRLQLRAHLNVPDESKHIDRSKLDIHWHSENPQVVEVDQRGRIRAMQPGTARVSVSIANPDIDSKAAICFITVRSAAQKLSKSKKAGKR